VATIKGGNANDTKYGTASADQIYGYGGNDGLYGRAGNDSIWGGDGIDKIWGEAGNDTLRGENHDDHIYSGDGDDLVYGGAGNDQLFGDGGTDKIFGDAGNDILKGGTGKAFLYGGVGNDSLYYGPTETDISKMGTYFGGSVLDGGSGTDTLHVYNSAKVGTVAAHTNVFMGDGDEISGGIFFAGHSGDSGLNETSYDFGKAVGNFTGIEHLTFTGNGGLTYMSMYGKNPASVTGTTADDGFFAFGAPGKSTTYKGGAGNDAFAVGANDKIVSEVNDADTFSFHDGYGYGYGANVSTVTGFNGIGKDGGDIAQFSKMDFSNPAKQITQSNGWTTFTMNSGDTVKIQGVGLVENIDFFIA
jgi:hypothetical protein